MTLTVFLHVAVCAYVNMPHCLVNCNLQIQLSAKKGPFTVTTFMMAGRYMYFHSESAFPGKPPTANVL